MTALRVLHLIPGLDVGGAEKVLLDLAVGLRQHQVQSHVTTMKPGGTMRSQFETAGVGVRSLDVTHALGLLRARGRWRALMREVRPHIVQSWLYHADVFAALTRDSTPLAWGVHFSVDAAQPLPPKTRLSRALAVRLSRRAPATIICCSNAAAQQHERIGYPGDLLQVIPNGVDTEQFVPSEVARARLRQQLEVEATTPLVGLFARYHAQKDIPTFVEAAAQLQRQMPESQFVLAGAGMQRSNAQLMSLLEARRLTPSFHLLGPRRDMVDLYNGIDLFASTSCYGEALPLVLCEAMSCGTPCVATDIGDSGEIIGDTGIVVATTAPQVTADAWLRTLRQAARPRPDARARIVARYSVATMTERYAEAYRGLVPTA